MAFAISWSFTALFLPVPLVSQPRSSSGCKTAPSTAVEALEHCDPAYFSNASVLLTVLATLPVTTCSAERSFSVLRILKTYLRARMGEERLTGLALMYIHSDLKIDLTTLSTVSARRTDD